MIRYAITDISREATGPRARLAALLASVQRWASLGIDYVQLREKSLPAGELFALVAAVSDEVRASGTQMKLLVNGRADIAVAAGANGVHLRSSQGEITPSQVRTLFARSGLPAPFISISCHSSEEVSRATDAGADLILFGPVFEKVVGESSVSAGLGLPELALAVQAARGARVVALGGITRANTTACLAAGAAGIAGIRLFR